MQRFFCWRCGCDVPMLDEDEFAEVWPLYRDSLILHKNVAGEIRAGRATLADLYRPMLDVYERLTGFRESNPKAVLHHRAALYGPPCRACGRPLRTPQAAACVTCGADRHAEPGAAADAGAGPAEAT